jgi:hypothetical protein
MLPQLQDLNGRKLCVVFVKVIDQTAGKVQMQTLHGRAKVDGRKLELITPENAVFAVPNSALSNVLPSDGTEILKDAEYFVIVKVDQGIEMFGNSTTI